jgi:hypothetical protein
MSNLTDAQLQELLKHIAERKPVTALLHEGSPFGTVMMLAEEVSKWRRLYLDKPEDRLWHDSDKTWWTRQDDTHLGVGALYKAEPPRALTQLAMAARETLHFLEDVQKKPSTELRELRSEIETLTAKLRAAFEAAR